MPSTGYVWLIRPLPNDSVFSILQNEFVFEAWKNDQDNPGEGGYREI